MVKLPRDADPLKVIHESRKARCYENWYPWQAIENIGCNTIRIFKEIYNIMIGGNKY